MTRAVTAGLSLAEVYEATWHELVLVIDAYRERLVDQQWLFAWHLAPLLTVWGGKEVTSKHLMGVTMRLEEPSDV